MKRWICPLLVCLLLCLSMSASAQVERCAVLDTALSLLEQDNLFLTRYNEITGAQVEPVFPLGVPYFYGGNSAGPVFAKLPDYVTRKCWQNSPIYYRAGTRYVSGFDCGGFTHWVCQTAGLRDHAKLNEMLNDRYHKAGRHLFCDEKNNLPAWQYLAGYLLPGDLLVCRAGNGYHIMMFAGTLRDYGFTAEEVGAAAPYLDYPLVIHCSAHPAFGERFEKFINETRGKFNGCATTDGGVAISLLGPDPREAPFEGVMQKQEHHWFELDDGNLLLNVVDFAHYDHFAWLRMGTK